MNITFYLFSQFQLLDLTGPLATLQMATLAADVPEYSFRYVSQSGGPVVSSVGIPIPTEPTSGPVDSLLIVGGSGVFLERSYPEALEAVRKLASGASRVGSVCTGAFLLAEAGLLKGRSATTHWRAAKQFRTLYPGVRLDADRIFVEDGRFWTSAGVTAGIDLTLMWIERDWGQEVARATARELVVYHRRPGGQSQFSQLQRLEPRSERLNRVCSWIRDHLADDITVDTLAELACLSPRQVSRAFRSEIGETPGKVVERLRAEAARNAVVDSTDPIETIAMKCGFGDPERMRRAFLRCYGLPPQALRRTVSRP